MARKKRTKQPDLAYENLLDGLAELMMNPMFDALRYRVRLVRRDDNLCPADGWAVVTSAGQIHVHPTRMADPEEWTYILAHCFLHMGFGHFQRHENPVVWNVACDYYITRFLKEFKLGHPPETLRGEDIELPKSSEEQLYERFCEQGISGSLSTGSPNSCDMIFGLRELGLKWQNKHWQEKFGYGVTRAVTSALNVAAGRELYLGTNKCELSNAQKAQVWFISNYPLLGALAANFKIIEDPVLCARLKISIAAVNAEQRQIFMNPAAGLDERECRFVMAHELLHAGLRHQERRGWRDPYLWNVACDYVINQWLVEMGFGDIPDFGGMLDPTLKGQSAEEVYDRIVNDMRRYRKLATLRGVGASDMLTPQNPDWWSIGDGIELDEFYRRCLAIGALCHQDERGSLPAGLVQEIQALAQPPIPWDVKLVQWFDRYFPPLDRQRSYNRVSRRQAACPDIVRPGWLPAPELEGRTFGVILDTSGSMGSTVLAKALGAIASYCVSREIPVVRLVCCDADAYDKGYMTPETVAGVVKIEGRGGTVLQPAIDLLESAEDFPREGPLLIVTDGECDRLNITRDHAFLMPEAGILPFAPDGPIFRIN